MHTAFAAEVVRHPTTQPVTCPDQRLPACPASGCQGTLDYYPSAQSSYDAVTGLDHLVCGICGHHGMRRAANGLHLVFHGSDGYVFHYPPSLATLTITVSPSLLAPFTWHGLAPAQAVAHMADWLLLTGRAKGIIRFADEKLAWQDCYEYVRRSLIP
jgi:hypothetical protein